jgi:hypothetical protein
MSQPTTAKRNFISQPDLEPWIDICFESDPEDKLIEGELIWGRDNVMIVQGLQESIKEDIGLDLAIIFDQFYANPETTNQGQFFDTLESKINDAGYYTYNSDNWFIIFKTEDVDLTDEDIQADLYE